MTKLALVLVLGLGLALATGSVAHAQCSSTRCTDLPAVDNVRSVIAAACDCAGATSHKAYVRCAKQIVKGAIQEVTLPPACKKPVLKCEAKSTCGSSANICCVSRNGRVKAQQVKGSRCGGNLCQNKMALVDACTAEAACAKRKGIRSFKSVQRVFQTSCALATCHSTFAREGELILDSEDVSFKNLVNRAAELPEATGLTRVVPGNPASSFLIQKLRGTGPGDPMPDSGVPLAEPIIEMVEEWIARGAKSTAEECAAPAPGAESLCDDSDEIPGDYHWEPLPALEPPPPTEGIQMVLPAEPVPSGTEWEKCYAIRPNWTQVAQDMGLPAGSLPFIKQQTYRMHPGSHHLLLYAYLGKFPDQWAEGYFPCIAANCVNSGDCPADADGIDDPGNPDDDDSALVLPIGGTQVAGTRYEVNYPAGVGIPVLGADMVLIVNPHYTNPFQPAQPIYGEAWLNLLFHKQGEFKVVLDGIFAINFADLFVEPYQSRTISRVWVPRGLLTGGNTDAAVFQLFGHMHKRATEFQIDFVRGGSCSGNQRPCGRDGDCPGGQACIRIPGAEDTTIYYTTSWDLAPIVDFPQPYFHVDADEGLRWTCTHVNGVEGDATRPPKKCEAGCTTCGWDEPTRTCIFTRGAQLGIPGYSPNKIYAEGDPMPLVFGQLADDDMCNMFGYFINQRDLETIGVFP